MLESITKAASMNVCGFKIIDQGREGMITQIKDSLM
jgi:hypothetical protein